nr:type II toxin-antitoxin system RelE/ParE family toxin [Rhodopila globiformis]
MAFTPEARQQVSDLRQYYEERDRPAAIRGLSDALEAAWKRIVANPAAGLAAPRPYPALASRGRAWIKSGRYWIAYSTTDTPVIVGVFYDAADIPNRV